MTGDGIKARDAAEAARIEQKLRQSKRLEITGRVEVMAFAELKAARSPWLAARSIRVRALLDEIDADLGELDQHRRDLALRLRLTNSAVQAAQAYTRAKSTS
ncbi:hypothetical protein [Dongia sp.]|uniref:hypothetical protein n=1 Tax=Dongia sp. TaxID=1977262 RepID=UPI0035ADCCFF